MSSALLYLAICVMGYIIAIPLRKYKDRLNWFGKAQTLSVLFLVFFMGVRVGSNEDVVKNLDSYGLYALIFTVIVLIFSLIAVHFARIIIGLDRYGLAKASASADSAEGSSGAAPSGDEETKVSRGIDRMTLLILICVAIGISSGYFILLGMFGQETLASTSSLMITIGLCVLLVFVGLDLGLEGKVFTDIRRVGLKILIIPFALMLGTLVGSVLCMFILPLALNESLAVGGGFAWYSLAASIIIDAGHEAAGAISFMHNIMRELFGIVFVPLVAKRIGYVECLSLPASTCMDVCLPIVEQSTNGSTTVYSFITGFVTSMSVPFVVPLVLSI
ncbi:MAG: lysine exporter LysO family protein [Bacillota bacterium]|nr:lysine exporter LysO family protein [Bacillota bacterium]